MGRPPGGSDRYRDLIGPLPLVGRRRELQQLRTAVDGLDSGAGSTVLVEGEPGIGKSRLLRCGAQIAAERGFATFYGKGEELERHRPLHAFTGLLDVGPGPGLSTPSEDALVDAVVDRVAELATRSPVVLVVDDLNWCDRASLRATGALARRPGTERVLVLAGALPLPRSRSLDRVCELLLGPAGWHLLLGPLPSPEVEELAATLLGARPGPTLEAVLGKAGGSPLYVTQLLRALVEEGAVHVVDGRAECTCTVLPSSLRRVVLQRLAILPDPVQQLLQLASILGDPFTITDLEALTGADPVALAGPLASAARAGVLADRRPPAPAGKVDDRLSFRHEMMREALYTDLPAAVRTGLHRRAGEALAAAGAPPPRVARQLALGARRDEPSTAQAVTWLRTATCWPGTPATTAMALLEPAPHRDLRQAAAFSGQRARSSETAAAGEDGADAVRDRGRVTGRLRPLGVRPRPSAGPQRPTTGWGALTATERTVVVLVAEGLTNRQIGDRLFISRRTVETHLAHTFDKLGVPNRAGAAAVAAQHRLDAGPASGPEVEERLPAPP